MKEEMCLKSIGHLNLYMLLTGEMFTVSDIPSKCYYFTVVDVMKPKNDHQKQEGNIGCTLYVRSQK